jgi:hypothetical protein
VCKEKKEGELFLHSSSLLPTKEGKNLQLAKFRPPFFFFECLMTKPTKKKKGATSIH